MKNVMKDVILEHFNKLHDTSAVRNGHARTFSSELIHILLQKIQEVRNIS
jgi:hypothetical protein